MELSSTVSRLASTVSYTHLFTGAQVLVVGPLVVVQDTEDGSVGRWLVCLVLLVLLVVHSLPSFGGASQPG